MVAAKFRKHKAHHSRHGSNNQDAKEMVIILIFDFFCLTINLLICVALRLLCAAQDVARLLLCCVEKNLCWQYDYVDQSPPTSEQNISSRECLHMSCLSVCVHVCPDTTSAKQQTLNTHCQQRFFSTQHKSNLATSCAAHSSLKATNNQTKQQTGRRRQ